MKLFKSRNHTEFKKLPGFNGGAPRDNSRKHVHFSVGCTGLMFGLGGCALIFLLAGCSSFFGLGTQKKQQKVQSTTRTLPISTALTASNFQDQTGVLSPTVDLIAQQVLQNISQHGWNPSATMHGQVIGGLYINWKMNDPSQTNALKQGIDDATSGSHDPQVDLFYLNALAEYHVLHSQDHTFSDQVTKATNQILGEFAHYSLPKGWIYFYLLRDGLLLHNNELVQEAHDVAQNYYTRWYDPTVGMVYNRAHTPGVYAAEHTITAGSALIDAGTRWHNAAWVAAGKSTLDKALSAAIDPQSHLFYNNMTVQANGSQSIMNAQAKPSAQGSIVEALVKAYIVTHDQHYLDVAQQTLSALFSSGLWDTTNGGLYFAKDLDTGKIHTDYKETRSQIHVLIGLYQYNQVLRVAGQPLQFLDKQNALIDILEHRDYQSTYHGYFYRTTPAFQVYTSQPGTGIGYEDFFTTEAMGLALDALQQTEFAHLPS